MKKFLYLALLSVIFVSCSQNAFEEVLFRTTDDPFYDVPVSDSLSLEHTVFLSWKSDDACDSFRLMRSYDQNTLRFSCIYEGKDTGYTDTDLTDGNCYIYRLDKVRGQKCFEGKEYAYGVSSACRKDESEANDVEEDAAFLEYDLQCNLPCVRYITNNHEELDCDWFYVIIPPRRTADIVINQNTHLQNGSQYIDLRIMEKGKEGSVIVQDQATQIHNPSYETKKIYFKVFPETTGILTSPNGIAVIEYTISLNQITEY